MFQVLVFIGIYLVIDEDISYEEPFRPLEAFVIVVHYGGHFTIIFALLYGVSKVRSIKSSFTIICL